MCCESQNPELRAIMLKYHNEQLEKAEKVQQAVSEIYSLNDEDVIRVSKLTDDTIADFEKEMEENSIRAGYIGLPYIFNIIYGIKIVFDWLKTSHNSGEVPEKVKRIIKDDRKIYGKAFDSLVKESQ